MTSEYNYTISNDFGNDIINLETSTLHLSIVNDNGITPILLGITVNDNEDVIITFDSALSAGEQTTLDGLVSSHVPLNYVIDDFMYGAVVDYKGGGNYLKLSEAIADGKNTIFIKSGIYYEIGDIILPDNIHIVGEDKSSVIINFGFTNSGLILDGGASIEISGTIAVTNASTTVTGTGTTFTNLVPNDYIEITKINYQIASIQSDTSLTLKSPYGGVIASGLGYKATTYKTGSLSNFTLLFSAGNLLTLTNTMNVSLSNLGIGIGTKGIYLSNCTQFLIFTCVIFSCTKGIHMEDCSNYGLSQIVLKGGTQEGIYMNQCSDLRAESVNIFGCGTDGLKITSSTESMQLLGIISAGNIGKGIYANSSGDTVLNGCMTLDNGGVGTDTSGSGSESIGNCTSKNNGGTGFEISNECIMNGCISKNNTIGVVINEKCSISGCNISDNIGNGISWLSVYDNNVITSCQIHNNGGTGIDILGTDNIVSLNIVKGNTTAQITDGGTSTIVVNNKT